MIAVLPPTRALGKLVVLETYVYYDGPKLFACRNDNGQIYFCIWTDDSTLIDEYLFSSVSQNRYIALRSGALSIRTAFLEPEQGVLFRYSVQRASDSAKVEPILVEQVDEGVIPGPDQFLRLATETMPIRFADLDLRSRAQGFRRDVLGLHLDFNNATREEAPTGGLGKILVGIQETVDAFGQVLSGEVTLSGAISPAILAETQTQVVYAGGGSFALEIVASNGVDLFSNALITDAINKVTDLITAGSTYESLRELLIEARPRAASKYRKLLSALVSSQASLRLDWASPDVSRDREVTLPFEVARRALRTAEQLTRELGETREFEGYFDGIEIPRRFFLAIAEPSNAEYRGRILDSAMEEAEHVTIKDRYLIRIKETIEITITGDERPRYELESIDKLATANPA